MSYSSQKGYLSWPATHGQMFERLPSIPSSQELLDRGFSRGSKMARGDPAGEEVFVRTASKVLSDSLSKLVRAFPSFETLPPFYRELAEVMVGTDKIRIHLSRLSWASQQIRKVAREYRRSRSYSSDAKKMALGRMASIMHSIEPDLNFLYEARGKLRHLPQIDPSAKTLIIAGYPNVGKSSFLAQVTRARPEVASYPFTTQGLIVGHLTRDHERYQVVDTPGLLDRPLEKRNEIERQAVAALRHLRGVILFILDPSGHCGYPLEEQLELLEEMQRWIELPVVVAVNKSDLSDYPCPWRMSTISGQGVEEVLNHLLKVVNQDVESFRTTSI